MAVQQAPGFTLPHVKGRQVSLSDYRGRPVVLIFSGRSTGEQADAILRDIRAHKNPEEVSVISVADVHGVPRLLHGVAKKDIEKAYTRSADAAAQDLRARNRIIPDDMSNVVVLVLDWDGKMLSQYGIAGLDKQATAVLVDANGNIQGQASGPQASQQLLAMLQ